MRRAAEQRHEVHTGEARAGGSPHGRRLRQGPQQGGRMHGHQRPGRHKPGHGAGDRTDRQQSGSGCHWPGEQGRPRQRRVPGVRHHRGLGQRHQVQHPGHVGRGDT